MKKIVKQMTRLCLSVVLVLSLIISNCTWIEAKKISKEETVYVNADASGAVNEITVSDWLKGAENASGSISDKSDLMNITNVKGDEKFTQDGQSIAWSAAGKDIYYQGKSSKELPVDLAITYSLDGKEIAAKDLVGKSGKVKIHVRYTNQSKQTKMIQGKEETICKLYEEWILSKDVKDSSKRIYLQAISNIPQSAPISSYTKNFVIHTISSYQDTQIRTNQKRLDRLKSFAKYLYKTKKINAETLQNILDIEIH